MQRKQAIHYPLLGFVIILLALFVSSPVIAKSNTNVFNNQAIPNFPDSITFQATIESPVEIESVVLEYGTRQLTCGTVVAKAFPQFSSSKNVSIDWTWEMKQSGSLPPGATIWWRWRYMDANGNEGVSDERTIIWLDNKHSWQTVTSGPINLHWYSGDQTFAQDLLNAAVTGLERLQNDAGLQPEKPINIYIYSNTYDLKDAILYEPSWTGGLAFSEHDIVIIGISEQDLEWGRDTIAHELTHVLVGHLTFSCLGSLPTWLSEGLAVYSEGELDAASERQLNDAIRNDQLLTIRSLSGGFSEVPDKAHLSYSQSYSIVNFLIETYGQDKMNTLLITLRDGTTIDDALIRIYGFDVDGLEDAWRDAIDASPQVTSMQPTIQPTPTFVATYLPFAASSLVTTPTPFAIPTSSTSDDPYSPPSEPPFSLTLILAAVCCVLILLFGVLGLGLYLSAQKRKGNDHEPKA